jgi:hypothetical protein
MGKICVCTKWARERLANENALIGYQHRFIIRF